MDDAHISLDTLPGDPVDFETCEDGDDGLQGQIRSLVSASQRPATWLVAAFEKWGVEYELVDGWEDRGRPASSGAFDPKYGLLVHHTGSKSSATNPHPALGLLVRGHDELPGPLCQVSTGYDGITRIVAAGRANHAGSARAVMGNPAGDGNAMYIGNEVDTNGTQAMPKEQYDAVVLSSAAILDAQGYRVADKLGLHNTTSLSGKWDLGAGNGVFGVPYSITRLRSDVLARLIAGPPNKEDDVSFSEQIPKKDGTDRTATAASMLGWIDIRTYRAEKVLARLEATEAAQQVALDNLTKAVATLAGGGQLLPLEEQARILREEVKAKLDTLDFVVREETP